MKTEVIHDILEQRYEIMHNISTDYIMTPHFHKHYEIYFSISGGSHFFIDGIAYEIKLGDLFLIPCNKIHQTVTIPKEIYERYVIILKPEYFNFLLNEGTQLTDCFSYCDSNHFYKLTLNREQQLGLKSLLSKSENLYEYGKDILTLSIILEILVYINNIFDVSYMTKSADNMPYTHNKRHTDNKILPILTYIEENLGCDLSLKIISNRLFLSEHYLCKIFKKYTGTTINRYIIQRRVSEAKKLLNQGVQIKEVYENVGFNDYCHFIRTFKSIVGMPPSKYTKKDRVV